MSYFELISSDWEKHFKSALRDRPNSIKIICPFIKQKIARLFLKKHAKIRVITRFNELDFYQGVNDLSAIKDFLSQGAKIRGLKGLHAKVYLFGNECAIVTSANLTQAAMNTNREFGFKTNQKEIIKKCHEYFDACWNEGLSDLTLETFSGWEHKIQKAQSEKKHINMPKFDDHGKKSTTSNPIIPSELDASDVNQRGFIKFFGNRQKRFNDPNRPNQEKLCTSIRAEIVNSDSHETCSYPNPPKQIRDGDYIFVSRLTNDGDQRIYGYGIAKVDSENDLATEEDIQKRKFKAEYKYLTRYLDNPSPCFIDATLSEGISFSSFLDELKYDAFACTQRHHQKGKGNIDPRKSISQKSHMQLTPKAIEWLKEKIDEKISHHGSVNIKELPDLPTIAAK